ncbi:alpha/beta fold hydrolase [Cupriavidus sp. AU9028]|uniref:alpha/beta hydrolase family protein n=1 Tax=Cupriavidus sp. AU9028 TaxID=2871157 RepID=UPI001C986E31|nr:alpha/beta fold hydrolase [Cupriavidus sp. AU9028]MBY4897044.1 alpha/beta fold hydrolase [Cupriavidus sp. AU9028]
MRSDEVAFRSDGIELAGTLTIPDCRGRAPTVILAAGSGHHDRDETVCGKRPFLAIANHLAQGGYAVLRFDSRGVGASGGTTAETTFDTKVQDLQAAHAFLRADARIDRERIVLIGHSEGALTALACGRRTGSAVAMLAGPAVPIEELLHRQAWKVSASSGATPAQLEYERSMNARVFALIKADPASASLHYRATQLILDALSGWPDPPWDRSADLAATAAQMASTVTAADFRTLLVQDPAALLRSFPHALAAIFGEYDQQVEADCNLRSFRAATARHPLARACILARHNHLLQEANTGALDEYARLDPTPSAAALRHLANWLDEVCGRE